MNPDSLVLNPYATWLVYQPRVRQRIAPPPPVNYGWVLPVSKAPFCPRTHIRSLVKSARGGSWHGFPEEGREAEERQTPMRAASVQEALGRDRLHLLPISSEPGEAGTNTPGLR